MQGADDDAYFRYARKKQRRNAQAIDDQRGISSAGRAPALQAGGRRFDPVILHHYLVVKPDSDRHLSLNTKAVSQETVLLLIPDSRINAAVL